MRSQRRLPLPVALILLLTWALFACEISRAQDLALAGAKIYPSPAGPAIEGGTVLVQGGRIVAVGPSATDVAKAIVAEAHREGKPVFAHPSNGAGIEIALQSGVNVLAHPSTDGNPFTPSLIARLKAAHMALIPTLTLLDVEGKRGNIPPVDIEKWINMAVLEVKAYSDAGGQILFGTDVGYIDQFDTTEEFTLMSRAGMDFREILASLTTNPAGRFGSATHTGRIAKGMDGDLVVLRADPSVDAAAFAKVKYAIRGGKVIHSEP